MKDNGLTYSLLVSGGHCWVNHRGVWLKGRGLARTLGAGVLPLSNEDQSVVRNLPFYCSNSRWNKCVFMKVTYQSDQALLHTTPLWV